MSASKNNSVPSSLNRSIPSIADNDDGGDCGKMKKEESTFTDSCKALTIVTINEGEEPCCSKSLSRHVRFFDAPNDDDNQGETVKMEFITDSHVAPKKTLLQPPPLTSLPPAIHHKPKKPQQDGQFEFSNNKNEVDDRTEDDLVVDSLGIISRPFSDTVLVLPNLHEYEENQENDNDDDYAKEQGMPGFERENLEGVNESCQICYAKPAEISRKSPKTNVCLEHNDNTSDNDNGTDEKNRFEMDENNNAIIWPTDAKQKLLKHASYIFHKDRRGEIERLSGLMPRGREYVIFNVFGDFARLLGFRGKRKKRVAFPEEFLEKYEQQGDVAGKDRFVPTAKQPYKGLQASSKKRKLSAVYSSWTIKSGLFMPHMERVDDDSKFSVCCENFIHSPCPCSSKKHADTAAIMEGYLCDLNTASLFLQGHASQTFEFAMSNLEFIRLHENVSATGQVPWSPNYNKVRIGVLAGSIWTFVYSIRTIIQEVRIRDVSHNLTSLPSESNFRRVMEQFATLCLTIAENVRSVLQYNHNFYNFCKECQRILKVLQIHIGFKGEIKINPPLRRGDGLELNRTLSKRQIARTKAIQVVVARAVRRESKDEDPDTKAENVEPEIEWKKFEELTGTEKAMCLRHLLNVTSEGMNMVQTQVRFLVDDIVDMTMDVSQPDLLFVMADMYDRIKFLENMGRKAVKTEFEHISKAMTEFSNDLQNFINYGQHIIKRFVELRDMVHLAYEYLTNGLNLESLEEMVPSTTFKKKRAVGCCGTTKTPTPKGKKKVISSYEPRYKPADFFRVHFQDMVKFKGEIQTSRFTFRFEKSSQRIEAIVPTGSFSNWGDVDLPSPRLSFEMEYMDKDFDDDIDGGAGDKDKVEAAPILKPILVGAPAPAPVKRESLELDEPEGKKSPPLQSQSKEPIVENGDDGSGGNPQNTVRK